MWSSSLFRDRADFVRLNLGHLEPCDGLVVESTTALCCSFEPAVDCVPPGSLHPRDAGLADTLDAERGDFVEGALRVLESVVGRTLRRAESLAAGCAAVAATLAARHLVAAVADDGGRFRASGVGAA